MKVNGPSKPGHVHLREVGKPARVQGTSRRTAGEHVQVSSRARVLASSRDPEVPDQSRIERLKAAIAEGTFEIDVDRIADAMIREEL
ncbi:MAG: flagellar biosynthesis anti-sigma factor FlgM [Myxococcales bacterium]|nr:flagellar biosynthesis anti-sigma factor FlgM [Myxococcales bacterium]MDD9965672.1 flagellar biosynthesis anti-sigma factor FlgM [Myxococcales bacterium]